MEQDRSNDVPGMGPWRARADVESTGDAIIGSVASHFLDVARRYPDRPALRSPAGAWTYRSLADDARQVASGLCAALGGRRGCPVAVLAEHDGPLVVAILGVMLSGHIVVVLDPTAPDEHTREMLEECAPAAVVHDPDHAAAAGAMATSQMAVLAIDDILRSTVEPPDRGPDDAVMLAFTSGTSGRPKAGVITNGVLLNLVRGATAALGISERDRMPMLFPASLAVAAYPMLLPLLNGGCLCTLDIRGVGLAPVGEFFERERITLAYMAPTVIRFLVDSLGGRSFPDLRLVALGGEPVDREVVDLTRQLFSPELLANGFGTTETGVVSLYIIEPNAELPEVVPAGYPVPDTEIAILDDAGRPVGAGCAGEIAVVSPHLFGGYWGHPELTATVLRVDPRGRPGWRLYRTGDLGRLDEHGALVVLGRVDTKVKVRGRFVVLGDVEADLHELAGVADAAAVAVEEHGRTELLAVVVPQAGVRMDAPAARAALLERREPYRVPTRWEVVESLPRLPNGKLDRQAVAALGSGDHPTSAVSTEPAEDEQLVRELRDVWEVLLPVGVVGPDDDFFHLGGDSLRAAQMLVEVEHRTGVAVPMGQLVHARTLRSLHDVIVQLRNAAGPPTTAVPVQLGSVARPRLWFVHDLQGSAYRVRHLAEHLGEDQPVWSFESPLLAGSPNRWTSLEDFASVYVEDLVAAQPDGPYWLGGYSFGGICAYEMARQLVSRGHEVAFLAVVDVGPGYRGPGWHDQHSPRRPWFGVAKPPEPGSRANEVVAHYRSMFEVGGPKVLLRHLMVRSGIARLVDPLRFRADLRRRRRVRPEWRLWYAWEEHWRLAATAWDRASRYEGRIDLYWADQTPSADSTMGWGPLVGGVEIHRFPGDHEGILEPRGARSLATALRRTIDDRWGA